MAAANGLVRASAEKPLFTFGVIADVQYADIPDGHSVLGVPRYYRHSITVLQRAVGAWNKRGAIKFSINFGDIVDGFCPKDKSLWAVQKVIDEFDKFDGLTYHMFGNHCLYNLPRSKLVALLNMPTDSDCAYYDFSPCPGYRFVILDAYDFSALGWPRDHPVTAAAMKLLGEKNPNTQKNSPLGLVGLDRRFVMFNGAVGKEQLSWLSDILKDASESRQCWNRLVLPGVCRPRDRVPGNAVSPGRLVSTPGGVFPGVFPGSVPGKCLFPGGRSSRKTRFGGRVRSLPRWCVRHHV